MKENRGGPDVVLVEDSAKKPDLISRPEYRCPIIPLAGASAHLADNPALQ
jgi:hypothetical protein